MSSGLHINGNAYNQTMPYRKQESLFVDRIIYTYNLLISSQNVNMKQYQTLYTEHCCHQTPLFSTQLATVTDNDVTMGYVCWSWFLEQGLTINDVFMYHMQPEQTKQKYTPMHNINITMQEYDCWTCSLKTDSHVCTESAGKGRTNIIMLKRV